jgi:hypothetical protein
MKTKGNRRQERERRNTLEIEYRTQREKEQVKSKKLEEKIGIID